MRVPIAYGISWPERMISGADPLNFARLGALTFEPPTRERFPGLYLAWEALRSAPGTTTVLNAANEVAVEAFLDRRLRFDRIHAVNHATLSSVHSSNADSLEDLLDLDAEARRMAHRQVDLLHTAT
jgi:1-deoxy-D-xylulose-5-phosphate reductoisomerase